MEVRKGYKQTEVGAIPNEWQCVTIGDIASPSSRKNTDRRNLPVLSCSKHYGFVESLKFFTKQVFSNDTSGYKVIRKGELGFPANHIEEGSIGFQIIYDEALVSPIYIVFCLSDKVDGAFIYAILKTDRYRQIFRSATSASVSRRGSLRWPEFSLIKVPLPPKLEQTAISAALNDTDALISSLEKLIAKKRNIKQGAIQELLTGKKRLPGFDHPNRNRLKSEIGLIPVDWEVDTIASTTPRNLKNAIVDGPFGSNLKTVHYRKSGIPIITSGYVTEGIFLATDYLYVDVEKFNQEKRSAVHAGDIVMAKIGARCGSSAIMPSWHKTGILSGNALKITVNNKRHSTYYIWQVLWQLYSTGNIEALKTVGAQPAISMSNLKKHKIPLPSLIEQTAIAQVLSDMDAEIEALEQKLTKYRMIKQGMMQELLTGKIRLV